MIGIARGKRAIEIGDDQTSHATSAAAIPDRGRGRFLDAVSTFVGSKKRYASSFTPSFTKNQAKA